MHHGTAPLTCFAARDQTSYTTYTRDADSSYGTVSAAPYSISLMELSFGAEAEAEAEACEGVAVVGAGPPAAVAPAGRLAAAAAAAAAEEEVEEEEAPLSSSGTWKRSRPARRLAVLVATYRGDCGTQRTCLGSTGTRLNGRHMGGQATQTSNA